MMMRDDGYDDHFFPRSVIATLAANLYLRRLADPIGVSELFSLRSLWFVIRRTSSTELFHPTLGDEQHACQ